MILYTVSKDAEFELEADIMSMEQKHNLKIVDVTKFEVELCKNMNEIYRGPKVYLFIGDWKNIIDYFIWDYPLEDIEELQDLVKSIKTIEI